MADHFPEISQVRSPDGSSEPGIDKSWTAAWTPTPPTTLAGMLELATSLIAFNQDFLWVVILGFVIAFILAFAVGANDVANSFGTSVGSKVLTLKQACIIAVIFETLGSCLLGSQVSDTIWKEIVDIQLYEGQPKTLLLGEVSALIGTSVWLIIATFLKIPVSGTHAIVGATMGFSIVKHGYYGIRWLRIVKIVASWFVSPVLAGAISGFLFMLVRRFILKSTNPLESGLRALPIFYAMTIFINTISIFLGGAIHQIPWWGAIIISTGLAMITALVVACWVVPWQRRTIQSNLRRLKAPTAIPIMCAMNCSVATNLDLLDELVGMDNNLTELATSTTTLNMLGDTDEMGPTAIAEGDDDDGIDYRKTSVYREAVDPKPRVPHIVVRNHDEPRQPLRSVLRKKSYVYRPPPEVDPVMDGYEYEGPNRSQQQDIKSVDDLGRAQLRMMRYSRAVPVAVVPPVEYAPLKKEDGPKERKKSVDNANFFVRCWQNIRTLGHREEEHKNPLKPPEDLPEIAAIFSFLQIMTATFTAFAHGGNDVSNAIGPVVAIWVVFSTGGVPESSSTPIWLLLFGGFGMSVGLCILGRKVIETVGSSLAVIIPSSGFCIGLGTASTVLLCSKIGLPVSTTHCIVGSVVAVGYLRSSRAVNWKVFGNIMGCALITVPFAGACSAGAMLLLGLLR